MNSGFTRFTISATPNGNAVRMMADSLPSADNVRTSPISFSRARRIALMLSSSSAKLPPDSR